MGTEKKQRKKEVWVDEKGSLPITQTGPRNNGQALRMPAISREREQVLLINSDGLPALSGGYGQR